MNNLAQEIEFPVIGTGGTALFALQDAVVKMQDWLQAHGFPPGYTITIGASSFTLDSTRYTDPQVADMMKECTQARPSYPVAGITFGRDYQTPYSQAGYLLRALQRGRASNRKRLEHLYELGKILSNSLTEGDTRGLRRLLGWTDRQFTDKTRL